MSYGGNCKCGGNCRCGKSAEQKFRHKKTGEIATQISLLDIKNWEKLDAESFSADTIDYIPIYIEDNEIEVLGVHNQKSKAIASIMESIRKELIENNMMDSGETFEEFYEHGIEFDKNIDQWGDGYGGIWLIEEYSKTGDGSKSKIESLNRLHKKVFDNESFSAEFEEKLCGNCDGHIESGMGFTIPPYHSPHTIWCESCYDYHFEAESFSADNDEEDRKHYQFKDDGEIEYLVFGKGRAAKRKTHLMVFSKAYGDKPFSMYDKFRGTPNGMACGVTNRAGIHTFQWDETLTPDAVNCIPCSKYVQSLRDKNWLFTEEKTAESFESESSLPKAYIMQNFEKKIPYEIHVAGCNHGNLAGGDSDAYVFGDESSSIKNTCKTFIGMWVDNFQGMPKEMKPSDAEIDAINNMTFSKFMKNKYVKSMVPVKLSPCCKKDIRIKEYCDNNLVKDIVSVRLDAEYYGADNQIRDYRNIGIGAALVAGIVYWFKR